MKVSRISIVTLALAVSLVTITPVFAGQAADQVSAAVEQSGVSRADREALLQEADRALRAGVPATDLEIIVRRARERGLTPNMVRELIRTTAHAGERGLAVRPVLDRIEQGLAKGASGEHIIAASARLAENLAAAGPLVDDLVRSGLRSASADDRAYAVETIARALERAIPGALVRDLGETAQRYGWTIAQFDRSVRTLTLFVGAGMPADSAGQMVRETIEHRFTERDYARLERRLGDLLGRGGAMDEVAGTVEREIKGFRDPGERRDNGGRERGADREPGGRGGRGR